MSLEFATPLAALVGLAALLAIAGALARERRASSVRRILRLAAPRRRARFASALAAAAVVALLATAAAQPRLRLGATARVRTDAQIYFLIDISKSMLARRGPGRPTRFHRAKELAIALRDSLADVPAGVASLTDRALPHLTPTADRAAFASVVHEALGIERPPPFASARVATDFSSIAELATSRYFAPTARHRLVILLTDGESAPFVVGNVADQLAEGHVRLLAVRLWNAGEAIYSGRGRRDPRYRPDPAALDPLRELVGRTAGGRVFGEGETHAVVAAARSAFGAGPTRPAGQEPRLVALAPYAVLAAVLPFLLLLRLRDARVAATRSRWPSSAAARGSAARVRPAPPP